MWDLSKQKKDELSSALNKTVEDFKKKYPNVDLCVDIVVMGSENGP